MDPIKVSLKRRIWCDKDFKTADFDVTIDIEKVIEKIGAKAALSKGGRAVECSGALRVDFIEWTK